MQAIEWVRRTCVYAHSSHATSSVRTLQLFALPLRPQSPLTINLCIASQTKAEALSLLKLSHIPDCLMVALNLIPHSDEVIGATRGIWGLDKSTGMSGHDDDDGGGNWGSSGRR